MGAAVNPHRLWQWASYGGLAVWALFLLWIAFASGCAGYTVGAQYTHHSSVPDYDDLNTSDMLGLCVEFPLAEHRYATEASVCLDYELDQEKPVYGDDPIGTLRIWQPLYRSD